MGGRCDTALRGILVLLFCDGLCYMTIFGAEAASAYALHYSGYMDTELPNPPI